jgi:Peptidase A4 family
MRVKYLATLLVVPLLVLGAATAHADSAPPTNDRHSEPVLGLQHVSHAASSSLNWAGYAVSNEPMTFRDVSGSWTQPNVVSCPKKKTTLAAFFVGIDGGIPSSTSVEQIGTEADCLGGVVTHFAWYEMYPAPPVNLSTTNYPVHPGDVLSAEVSYDSGTDQFTLALDNDCSCGQWPFSITLSAPVDAARTSAEWIAETPATGGHFWPLTNFGSVTFANASVTNDTPHTGDIDDGAWTADQINLVARRPNQTIATTSGLTNGGSSFTVTYQN